MIKKFSLLLTFFFSLHVCAEVSNPMKLYHGTLTDNIELLEPRLRYTPGEEEDSPAGIYATDDPAFAAAHAFPWSSLEGIDLHYEGRIPKKWVSCNSLYNTVLSHIFNKAPSF